MIGTITPWASVRITPNMLKILATAGNKNRYLLILTILSTISLPVWSLFETPSERIGLHCLAENNSVFVRFGDRGIDILFEAISKLFDKLV